jgi:hypothetical protein
MWSEIGEFIKAVAPVFTAGAACTGAWIGWWGLQKWRAETIGKRKAELAEDVIADFYEAKEISRDARIPGSTLADEGNSRPKREDETPEETKQYNAYYCVTERLSKKGEFFARLQARKYRIIAHFGVKAAKPYDDLREILREIRDAVHMLIATHKKQTPDRETQYRQWLATIYGGADEDDILKRLDAIVIAIEETCRPAIQETVKVHGGAVQTFR